MILAARHVLLSAEHLLEDAAVRVERGRLAEVFETGGREAARSRGGEDLGDGLLAPGFVNAHAHLELGDLQGRLPADQGFGAWVGALLRERSALTGADFERAVRRGARRLLATGTTTLADIDSTGACAAIASDLAPRFVVQREVLDAGDERRTPAALARVSRALRGGVGVREGLSPHAPYTTSRKLLSACAALAARRELAVAVHWAETPEEALWLEHGDGPLARVLTDSPRTPGLVLLEEAGLISPRSALIHGNHPTADEPERLARQGASVVHCPGTHRFFDRPAFPLDTYRRAGVGLALGTDSLASNEDLDMRREMALARATLGLSPREALHWATEGGARAVGWPEVGRLMPGAPADLVFHQLEASGGAERLDELTSGGGRVARVWIQGRALEPGA